MRALILVFTILLSSLAFSQAEVLVQVTNLRSNDGHIIVAIFEDEQTFKDEEPKTHKTFKKTKVKDGKLNLKVNLPPGSYGFTLVDDENKSGDLDYNLIGIPKEGFGFSNYYHTGMTKPSIEDFRVDIKEGKVNKVTCKIRYI